MNIILNIADGTFTDQESEQLFWLDLDKIEQFDLIPPVLKKSLKELDKSISHIIDIRT